MPSLHLMLKRKIRGECYETNVRKGNMKLISGAALTWGIIKRNFKIEARTHRENLLNRSSTQFGSISIKFRQSYLFDVLAAFIHCSVINASLQYCASDFTQAFICGISIKKNTQTGDRRGACAGVVFRTDHAASCY